MSARLANRQECSEVIPYKLGPLLQAGDSADRQTAAQAALQQLEMQAAEKGVTDSTAILALLSWD